MTSMNTDDGLQHSNSELTEPVTKVAMTPIRWIALAAGLAFTLFQMVSTEFRVTELKAEGFGDVVITSTRNHAYFPLIGGIVGALTSIVIVKALKRLFK